MIFLIRDLLVSQIMNKLHPVQKKLLDVLKKNHDNPLTVRELKELVDVSSTSVVHHHLLQLEKKGYLRRNPSNPHDYQVLADSPERKITYLNLYGLAACGPNGSILDGNPVDKIPISSKILGFASSEAFMVKAKGDSMYPSIKDGDLVIVKKATNVDDGRIAVCVNNEKAIIKKIKRENDEVILISLNPKEPPFLASEDFRIEGEVRGVLTHKI